MVEKLFKQDPWQGSVTQQLGCLEVGLLPNRRGFESRSEQDFGLCWVEVICENQINYHLVFFKCEDSIIKYMSYLSNAFIYHT